MLKDGERTCDHCHRMIADEEPYRTTTTHPDKLPGIVREDRKAVERYTVNPDGTMSLHICAACDLETALIEGHATN